ncbi:Peptidoglycan/LPS O-acetylase OafA/YrhL, contains acyltransferase and SGNH-hydrolase domains [Ralstonia sp. 25mfcol4.1]|uniref:acyltransferase family protein n=1 Tax=Ralstonia sp. 25mfcol4.1 TaxID=1761899 RepID=UPI0008876717|nr:acyltransferase family protein [Ralstonia sp. 25mfcol4.1]SDP82995.1 Peptidoglycan/LPS O-acetylase OafA/YrhL, contains acyltransferase and SGNH-hydrolase domains [Ralstonia sp. 25mfcol4.1]
MQRSLLAESDAALSNPTKAHVDQAGLSHPKYRPDIDGLRAIAVLSVVAFHAFPHWMQGGFIGVDVFFVISGFLISTIIFQNLDKGTFSFFEFYARRVKRIFPALLIVLACCYAFGWFALLSVEFKALGKHIAAGAGFVSNLVLWSESGYFDKSADTKPLLHLWSLGIEEQFYIIWPVLLWAAWKRKFNLATIATIIAAASLYLNLKGIKQDATATFYSPQTRFWELLCGSLLAWFVLYKQQDLRRFGRRVDRVLARVIYSAAQKNDGTTLSNALSVAGMLLLCFGFWHINHEFSFPGKWAVLPVLGAVFIIAAGPNGWVNKTFLAHPSAVRIGLISFPLYLWHWPLLSFARIVEAGVPSRNIRIGAVLAAIVLAWLTVQLVEKQIRGGGFTKLKVLVLASLMAVVGYFGYDAFEQNGYQDRFINVMNVGVNESLAYNWFIGFRYGECFLDPQNDPVQDFAGHCGANRDNHRSLLMIWGDSHAASLYRGFANNAASHNYNVAQYTVSACPPIMDFDGGQKRDCARLNQFTMQRIRELKPDTLVMAGYWAQYNGTKGWEKLDTEKLAATIDMVKKAGVRNVVLVGSLPVFSVSQPEMLKRAYVWSKIETRTYRNFDPAARTTNDQIHAVAEKSGASFISPMDYMCDKQGCLLSLTTDKVVPLAYDYGHLTTLGSDHLVSQFFEHGKIPLE